MSYSNIPGLGAEESAGLDTKDPLQDVLENKNLIFQALIVSGMLKLAKMKDGMKTLQILGKELIHGVFNSADSLAQSAAANAVSAWACPMLLSGLYERFGLLPPAFNHGFHDGISKITGINLTTGIVEMLFAKDGAFPSTLSFAKAPASSDADMLKAMAAFIK